MRGSDIEFNPVFLAYLVITRKEILLFVDCSKLPGNFSEHQAVNQVNIFVLEYDGIKACVEEIVTKTERKVWIAQSSSYFLTSLIPKKLLHHEVKFIFI